MCNFCPSYNKEWEKRERTVLSYFFMTDRKKNKIALLEKKGTSLDFILKFFSIYIYYIEYYTSKLFFKLF